MCRPRRKQRRERRKEHEREGRFRNSAAKRCYLKYWMKKRAPRRMQLKTGQIHSQPMEGMCVLSAQWLYRSSSWPKSLHCNLPSWVISLTQCMKTASRVVQTSACTYCFFAGELVCDMIHSFSFSAGGPGPMPVLVEDLFTFVGWQEHEISSGCTVAARPANSMALQVSCCSRYRLPCPLLPACRPLVLRVTPANKLSHRNWQGFIEVLETTQHSILMLDNKLYVYPNTHTNMPYLLYLHNL